MASKNDENWLAKFELLNAHVAETGHFPDKHCTLDHFCKYIRRKMNEGTMEAMTTALAVVRVVTLRAVALRTRVLTQPPSTP